MDGTKIVKCTCSHDFQDKIYGKQLRVANLTLKGTKDRPIYRCTVCLTQHS